MKRDSQANFRIQAHIEKRDTVLVLFSVFVAIIMSLCTIGISFMFKLFIDITSSVSIFSLGQVVLFAIMVVTLYAATIIISSELETRLYNRLESKMQIFVLNKIYGNSEEISRLYHTEEIMNRLTNDIKTVVQIVPDIANQFSTEFLTVLFAVITMYFLSWKLATVLLISLPLLILLVNSFSPMFQKFNLQYSQKTDKQRSYIHEIINHVLLFRSYDMKKHVLEKLVDLNKQKHNSSLKVARFGGLVSFLNNSVSFFVFITTLGVGVHYVLNEDIPVGNLIAMIQLSNYIVLPISRTSYWQSRVDEVHVSVKRINDICLPLKKSQIIKGSTDVSCETVKAIRIENLFFSYVGGTTQNVLEDINANFEKGKLTAILGPSGSGKSTLLKLLIGAYYPKQGGIKVCLENGVEETDLILFTAYVPSENFLFNDTVAQNICMGKPLDEIRLEFAMKNANIWDEIMALPNKADTCIEEGGSNFSLGQGQRIAIARAIYKNTPIIVFDEPTANLDPIAIQKFHETLMQLRKNKICIIVTHNLETASICDIVYEVYDKRLIVRSNRDPKEG